MTLKRTGFKRKLPVYVKAERIAPIHTRLTVKVNMPRADGGLGSIPKAAPVRSEAYRRLVAAMPCIHCGISGHSQAAHPPPTGKGIKEDDRECFPLCTIHHDAAGQLVDGCHFEFDQMRLVPRADMRSLAGHWAAQTRQAIRQAGQWPKNLPHLEIQNELELA